MIFVQATNGAEVAVDVNFDFGRLNRLGQTHKFEAQAIFSTASWPVIGHTTMANSTGLGAVQGLRKIGPHYSRASLKWELHSRKEETNTMEALWTSSASFCWIENSYG